MAKIPSPQTSFSSRRRWGIFFSVIVSIVAVVALVMMLNYLGARYYARLTWSAGRSMQLTPQTLGLLKSITNEVKVVVYYDKKDRLYSSITSLLDEYRLANPKISVQFVDYERDAAAALQIKTTYKLGSSDDKDLVIFECNGRYCIIPGAKLGEITYEQVPSSGNKPEFQDKLKAFDGEMWFTSALLNVTSPKPLTACFLEDKGEHPAGGDKATGYQKFIDILGQNNIRTSVITNTPGTNVTFGDFNLLIIAGPTRIIPPAELEKIRQYLAQGGRLFVLFNAYTWNINTGLESILADDWGIHVGNNIVKDPEHSSSESAQDVEVRDFSKTHELVNRLVGSSVQMILPRSVEKLNTSKQSPEGPTVEELAFTGEHAGIHDNLGDDFKPAGRKVPIIVAAEKGTVKGVFPERRAARIVVAGDSMFLDNQVIDSADNRNFARYAINWLMDQKQLMQGIGPRPVTEYKLMMTRAQMTSIRWIFLAGMPGAILALGGLVWLRRRH